MDRDTLRERIENIDHQRVASVLLVLLLLTAAPAGYVLAQTLSHQSTAGTTYQTNSGLTVTLTDDREVEASPFGGDDTFADGDLTLSGDGGAISIGHPYGMSGARMAGHLLLEGRGRDAKLGVVAMCVGGGQGACGLFEIF